MKPIQYINKRIDDREKIKNTAYAQLPYLGQLLEVDMTNGDHIMIYGRPKSGKTTLVLNYMLYLANTGVPITVFNTETVMSGYKYSTRLLALLMKQIAIDRRQMGFIVTSKIIDKFLLYGDELEYGNPELDAIYWEIYDEAVNKLSELDIEIYDASDGIINADTLYRYMGDIRYETVVCLDQINQIMDTKTPSKVERVSNVLDNVSQIIKERKLALFLVSQISTGSSSSVTGELPFGGYGLVAEINAACKPTRKNDSLKVEFTYVREAPPFTAMYTIDSESGLILTGRINGVETDEND